MAIYISSKSLIKKLYDRAPLFTSRKMMITAILLYLYSPTRTRCLKYFIYAVFRTSQKQLLKIFSYYIVFVLNLYLYGKICQYTLYNILPEIGISNHVLAAAGAAAAAAAAVVICYTRLCCCLINTFPSRGKYLHIL